MFPNEDKKKVFFYAGEDARYYDVVEELTQPCIDLIHDTMIDLVEYSILQKNPEGRTRPIAVLDVGSGTGAEAFRLLGRFPNVHIVAVDFSPPMNAEFAQKFSQNYPNSEFSSKVALVEEDFFSAACHPGALAGHMPITSSGSGFDAVVAGFFLHHYTSEEKRTFYQRSYQCLKEDGILVHGDLFGFQSQALSNFAHVFGQRWIEKQLSNPSAHLSEKFRKLGSDATRLHKDWLTHWNSTHIYHPAERAYVPSQLSTASVCESHEEMVIEAGFSELGYPFRLWEAGILWAAK